MQDAEIERARISAQVLSEVELLRARLHRARHKTRIAGSMAVCAATALAGGVLYFVFAAEPVRRDAERRLDGERQRSRKLDDRLGLQQLRLDALARELELLRRSKPAADLPAPPPARSAAPPAGRGAPRPPPRSDPRRKAPCVDNGDPLNPCLR